MQIVNPLGIWTPNAPNPAAAGFHVGTSDEFNGSSLDGKWNEFDVAGYMTATVDVATRRVHLTGVGNGSDRQSGIYQAIPGSEFAFYAKVSLITPIGRWSSIGLFVADLTVPSTADLETCQYAVGNSASPTADYVWQHNFWTQYNTVSTLRGSMTSLATGGYIRMRINGTSVKSDVSSDGVSWIQIGSVTTGFTPAHFGINFNSFLSGNTAIGIADFFRVYVGAGVSGIDATRIGRFV